jgi:hypothetical protein
MKIEALESGLATIGSRATYTGAGASIVSAAAQIDWGFWGGITLGVVGLIVNWYFKRRTDKREQAYHEALMRKLEEAGK